MGVCSIAQCRDSIIFSVFFNDKYTSKGVLLFHQSIHTILSWGVLHKVRPYIWPKSCDISKLFASASIYSSHVRWCRWNPAVVRRGPLSLFQDFHYFSFLIQSLWVWTVRIHSRNCSVNRMLLGILYSTLRAINGGIVCLREMSLQRLVFWLSFCSLVLLAQRVRILTGV